MPSVFKQRYLDLSRRYLRDPNVRELSQAAALGRELVSMNMGPEEIVEIFLSSVHRLAEEEGDPSLANNALALSCPLVETLLSYVRTLREEASELGGDLGSSILEECAARSDDAQSRSRRLM